MICVVCKEPDNHPVNSPSHRFPFLRKKRVLLFAVVAAALIFGAFHYDSTFRSWMLSEQSPHWKHTPEHAASVALSKYGDWIPLMGITAVAALIARGFGNRKWTKIFVTAIVASALAGILATSCRSLTGRTRPIATPPITPGWYGPYHNGRCLIGVHAYNSFPSGHTATAVGLAAVILFSQPLWGIPCMLVALAIAASRLYLGQHNLSDVTAALFLGLAVGWGTWRIAKRKGNIF